jgi:hypothetical protein
MFIRRANQPQNIVERVGTPTKSAIQPTVQSAAATNRMREPMTRIFD